jgi:TnpA family transposase
MTALNETAYPRLNPEPSPKELKDSFTPTADELALVDGMTGIASRPISRAATLMHLKMFQRLGQFCSVASVPLVIREHIAQQAGIAIRPTQKDLKQFESSGSYRIMLKALRKHLNVRPLAVADHAWLEVVAAAAADTKHAVADVINVMLEELVHHRYELPAFSTLDRLAFRAREASNDRHFASITDQLSVQDKAMLDALLKKTPGEPTSAWQMLKREPKKPTNKEARSYLQHVKHMQRLVEQLPKPDIPAPKLRQFRFLARALDAAEMAELKPLKRYALAVILIRSRHAQALDDAAELLIRLMQNLENTAREKLLQFQQDRSQKTDMLVGQLRDILDAYKIDGTDTQRVDAIGGTFRAEIEALMADCDELLAYAGRNSLPFMLQPYKAVRAQLLNCVEITAPKASTDDRVMEKMMATLSRLRISRSQVVPLTELNLDAIDDFGWMSAQWRKLVLLKTSGRGTPDAIDRRYFELAVLQQIKDEFKTGDLFIKHGERYDDYREQLVDAATYAKELPLYAVVTGIETRPAVFVAELKKALLARSRDVDAAFPANAHAEIVDGRLILRRPQRSENSEEVKALELQVTARMVPISIVDVLTDVARWLELHKHFRPLAGTDSRLEDLRMRVITTLFCYGCNLGPVQTARSIKGLSRRQHAWLNMKYVTEDTLDKAIVTVINAYNKFELPGYWGTGKHASADGTKWNLYEQNLMSEYHIRYGGYGGIGYYHVSDKFIALFSHFIACGTYEGVHILDGLMGNQSDIRPDTVHGDTQAQNYAVFALAHLLGIKLMPRIRGIKDLNFFRPDAKTKFDNIDALFADTIDWKLIETHLPSMLRIAVSIKTGKITPSAILRRLGTQNRKNKLYFAFRELGMAMRTMFLLEYIGDVELRRVIHAETNKSEQFNGFAKWSFFGGDGIIAENLRHEQRKIIKYNHLVANMVILHNVVGMTRVLKEMNAEGYVITPEMLGGLAPLRPGHINRFGDYTLDFRRKISPLDFDLAIIPKES